MISPEEELYAEVFSRIEALGYDTYPYLPDDDVSYPFVHVGNTIVTDEENNKTAIGGRVTQMIDIWHDEVLEIGRVMRIATEIRSTLRLIRKTRHFQYRITTYGITTTNMVDRTTSKPLRHYQMTVEFYFI